MHVRGKEARACEAVFLSASFCRNVGNPSWKRGEGHPFGYVSELELELLKPLVEDVRANAAVEGFHEAAEYSSVCHSAFCRRLRSLQSGVLDASYIHPYVGPILAGLTTPPIA